MTPDVERTVRARAHLPSRAGGGASGGPRETAVTLRTRPGDPGAVSLRLPAAVSADGVETDWTLPRRLLTAGPAGRAAATGVEVRSRPGGWLAITLRAGGGAERLSLRRADLRAFLRDSAPRDRAVGPGARRPARSARAPRPAARTAPVLAALAPGVGGRPAEPVRRAGRAR